MQFAQALRGRPKGIKQDVPKLRIITGKIRKKLHNFLD